MPDFYSIEDVLSFAIRLEQAAQEFYRLLSQKSHNQPVAQFLRTLVAEEELHESQLRQILDERGDALNHSISAEEVNRYVQAMKVSESLDYTSAVKLAMDKEKAAEMLYSVLAGVIDDATLKEMFLLLSTQEKAHKKFFEKEYRRIRVGKN
ncbi:MAG: ferritin-like domain-containing protein [Planctomycetota bacterium]|jgi:rubrerythrin